MLRTDFLPIGAGRFLSLLPTDTRRITRLFVTLFIRMYSSQGKDEELLVFFSFYLWSMAAFLNIFTPEEPLIIIFRYRGPPGKISFFSEVIGKMSLTLMVISGKNVPIIGVARMSPVRSCRWLCQVPLDLGLCMYRQFAAA